ncbi:hypothetical protein Tco_1287375, partial [Tanacetum coccineum]
MILKICSYSIFKKSLTICPRQTRLSFTQLFNMWIKKPGDPESCGWSYTIGIESYQTKINLERPNWDAADYYFKEDYTIVPKPRAVVYRDRNDQRKLMRLKELHKFSDGTLTRVWKNGHMVMKLKGSKKRGENKGKVPTEMELGLEFTQQGSSHEVLVSAEGVEELKGIIRIKGVKKETLHTLRQKPEHPSETMVFHNEDGNPARANIKQALGYLKDGDGDGNSQHLRYQ